MLVVMIPHRVCLGKTAALSWRFIRRVFESQRSCDLTHVLWREVHLATLNLSSNFVRVFLSQRFVLFGLYSIALSIHAACLQAIMLSMSMCRITLRNRENICGACNHADNSWCCLHFSSAAVIL